VETPAYGERRIDAPEMAPVREALDRVLTGHEPYPAAVVDRLWNLVAGNRSIELFTAMAAPELLEPPVNVLRVSLHPDGLAPHIANLAEWRAHLLERLQRQHALTADGRLADLLDELRGYPAPPVDEPFEIDEIAVPLRIRAGGGELAFYSTVATFGTAVDITLAELSIEAFFPANPETLRYLSRN
jgi:hypothetical protein